MDKVLKKLKEKWNMLESESKTMTLWHGGKLESSYNDSINHKKGRWEYGPGLYLTTHYGTAIKYAKGSNRLYQITIEKGVDIEDVKLDVELVNKFVSLYVIKSKRNDVMGNIVNISVNEQVDAYRFLNIIINYDAIKNTNTGILRTFLVESGIDYSMVSNPFGWGEMMVVLFNMNKIIDKKVITSKTKIEVYDLPTEFS